MIKKFMLAVFFVALFVVSSCKSREEKPVPKTDGVQPGLVAVEPGTKVGLKVVVPESVKGRWMAVKIAVEDKAAKKNRELTINLNSEAVIPDTGLKVFVGDFLPDFKMGDGTITSSSNELNNPAVNITVHEGNHEIFKGWLFSKFPNIHPFEHPKYGITLKEGINKG